MGAVVGDAAIVHHQDLVGVLDGGQTVGDGDDGLAPRQGGDGLLDQVLVLRVDAGGGLVQNGVRHGVGRAGGQAEQHHLGGIGCQRQQAPLHRQRRRGRSRRHQADEPVHTVEGHQPQHDAEHRQDDRQEQPAFLPLR